MAAGELIDADAETALAHTLVARRQASRIPAVREAVGLTAYRAGQWQTAIGELRAYQRITGRHTHMAVLADCERALGRPERAVDMYRAADRSQLSSQEAIELLIVAAGARADLGQRDAAVAMLQVRELTLDEPWVARLRYAYADALLAAGRGDESREWFARAAEIDEDAVTDAAERLLEIDGVVLDDFEEDGYDEDDSLGKADEDEDIDDDEADLDEADDLDDDEEGDIAGEDDVADDGDDDLEDVGEDEHDDAKGTAAEHLDTPDDTDQGRTDEVKVDGGKVGVPAGRTDDHDGNHDGQARSSSGHPSVTGAR